MKRFPIQMTSFRGLPHAQAAVFVYRKPLARRVVQKKTIVDTEERKPPFAIMEERSASYTSKGRSFRVNDVNSLSHTSWNCKYHIVFAPKYRRKVFYGKKRKEIGKILRTLCNWKKVKIIEAEVCSDHIHMLVEIPPQYAASRFMGYEKGKNSLMIYEKYPELKYKYRNRAFWCRGHCVDTAGKNKAGKQRTMGSF